MFQIKTCLVNPVPCYIKSKWRFFTSGFLIKLIVKKVEMEYKTIEANAFLKTCYEVHGAINLSLPYVKIIFLFYVLFWRGHNLTLQVWLS